MFELFVLAAVGVIIAAALILGSKIKPNELEQEIAPGVKPFVPSEEMGIFGTSRVRLDEFLEPGNPGFSLQEDENDPAVEKALEAGSELLDEGEEDRAVETLLAALADEPDNPDLLLALGDVYREMGFHEQARESFQKARDVLPGDVSVLERLAETYEILGLEAQALGAYQEIVQINPEIAGAAEAVERLEAELARVVD